MNWSGEFCYCHCSAEHLHPNHLLDERCCVLGERQGSRVRPHALSTELFLTFSQFLFLRHVPFKTCAESWNARAWTGLQCLCLRGLGSGQCNPRPRGRIEPLFLLLSGCHQPWLMALVQGGQRWPSPGHCTLVCEPCQAVQKPVVDFVLAI